MSDDDAGPRSSRATGRCTRRSRRPRRTSPALLPRVADADGVDVALCVPFTALQAVVDSTRGSRVEVYAQNMHEAAEGAFTGEVSAPMLTELDVARRRARPLRAPPVFGETDRALQQKVPAALDGRAQADAVRRRDRGGARGGRHRAQAAPPGPGGPREGRRASGWPTCRSPTSRSGRSARAGSRRPSRRRRRSRSSARWSPTVDKEAAERVRDPLRRLGEGRQRRRAAGAAGRRRRARRRRVAGPGVVRGDRRRGAGRGVTAPSRRSASSSSTAGAWPAAARATRSRWPTRR